jgi:hypothetical protein
MISNMITKSGLLQFLKQICLHTTFLRPNDVAIAIPRLLSRVWAGFMESPAEWDGQLDRSMWLQQFADMAVILSRNCQLSEIQDSDWHVSAHKRISRFVSSLTELQKRYSLFISIPQLVQPDSVPSDREQDPFDIDTLFAYL